MRKLLPLFNLLVVCVVLSSCAKDVIDTTGNIVGIVTDARTKEPIVGASITITPLGKTSTTGSDGRYEFRNVESQNYSVQAVKTDYQTDKKTVFVSAGEDADLDFQLTPSTPNLKVSQTTLDFGNTSTTLTLDLQNDGYAPLSWQISEDASWLSCSPTSGTIQSGEKTSVIVTIDRSGLERGNYSQTLAISSNGGSSVIRVNMTLAGISVSLSPEELDFGSTTTSQQLTMTNTGNGNISYSLVPSNEWIKLSKSTGVFSYTENVTVSVDRTQYSEGNYSGTVSLKIGDQTMEIPVRMNIPSKAKPTVSLQSTDNITYSGAVFKGAVVSIGSAKVTRYGFCWSETEQPQINSSSCNLGDCSSAKDYTYNASSLTPNTVYYVRAYAENTEGLSYSNQIKFQTTGTPQKPDVETGNVSGIQSSQVMVSGNITNIGNTDGVAQYGHVWSTKSNPTISDAKTQLGKTETTGAFNSTLTGLSPHTTYHVRAYATNSVGTSYGDDNSFTTSYGDVAITTNNASKVTYHTAVCGGTVTTAGGHIISSCGVCWSTSSSPTVSNSVAYSSSTGNTFTVSMTGLSATTTYHARAFVKTQEGQVYYGNSVSFNTTEKDISISKNKYGEENNWTR